MSSTSAGEIDPRADVDAARKYHVLMELGRGGSAVVHAGIARGAGGFAKLVVLKAIKDDFFSDRETVRMFINEARLSARMNHPNVVQVYEVFRKNRLPVIVMEYLDGQSLARVQRRAFHHPSYSTGAGIAILCRVLAGLHHAHTLTDYDGTPLKLVHRDVSPHNVMLTYDGQIKLLDFGVAKLSSSRQKTKTGVIKGKVTYMAPEQLEGGPLDHRADLFAVGVMLWEAIARRRMWDGRSEAEIVRSLALDAVPKISQAVPEVDPELALICDKALAASPDQRYANAEQFQTELESYLSRHRLIIRQHDIAELVNRSCIDLRDESAELLKQELAKFDAEERARAAFRNMPTQPPKRARRRDEDEVNITHGERRWLLALAALIAFGVLAAAYGWTG